jgi:CubicO group peptidase (beta-lactamase class C family)
MRIVKKILKWFSLTLLGLLIIANLAIVFTGRYYIYKGVWNTYFKGHVRPHIYDLDVFENREISAGEGQPWIDSPNISKLEITSSERERMELLDPASFIVAVGDTIIYEEYWGEHDRDRIGNSFSMSKSIVSLLIGVAIDEGKIGSIDESAVKYLPEMAGDKEKITIRHLLTMSSGLSWSESTISPFCDVAELYYDSDDRDLTLNRREVEEEPGEIWRYKSGDTQMLIYILEKATGKSVSEYASEKLWRPMGAESNAMWSLTGDENSSEKSFCCFYSTSRDFARLGRLVNNNGNWKGRQLVSEEYMNEFSTLAPLKKSNGKPNNCYGLQYWIYTGYDFETTFFRGMSGQYIISIPSKDLVIVRTGNGVENEDKNTVSSNDVNENFREDMFVYIDIGIRMFNEEKKLK